MTTDYPYSLAQLAQILSALENERRNPNTKRNAIKAIERAAARIGLTAEDVFDAADGLLSGRIDDGDFLSVLLADQSAETSRSCVMPNGGLLMVPPKTSAGTERVGKPVADEDADEPENSDVMPNTGPLAVEPRRRAGIRPDSKQARMIAMLRRPEGRHRRADRRSDGLGPPHRPRRHGRRAEEEARADHHLGEDRRPARLPDRRMTVSGHSEAP